MKAVGAVNCLVLRSIPVRSLRAAGIGLLALACTACINLGEAPGEIEAPQELASGIKNLVVYRRPAFFLDGKPVFLTLNHIDIAKIRINEVVEVGLAPGPHVLGARCSTSERPLTREWRLVEHKITITDVSELRYIELGPCLFTEETPQVAEAKIGTYKNRPLKDGAQVRLREWWAQTTQRINERLQSQSE